MKYHIISTGRGFGAIFTNKTEAVAYQKDHAGSTYSVTDRLPSRIPPKGSTRGRESIAKQTSSLPEITSEIIVHTDGSSIGNPGPGGYGIVMQIGSKVIEFSQGFHHTTNNRMEMLAVITALEKLEDRNCPVKIFSDSRYTIDGITKGWAKGWRRKGWKKGDGKPALNPDLWARLLELVEKMTVTFQWVKGHAGNPMNERADVLANSSAQGSGLIEDAGYKK